MDWHLEEMNQANRHAKKVTAIRAAWLAVEMRSVGTRDLQQSMEIHLVIQASKATRDFTTQKISKAKGAWWLTYPSEKNMDLTSVGMMT